MKIGFIGAGKVGVSLGKHFADCGVTVVGYYSRSQTSSKEAADYTNTLYYKHLSHLVADCDTLFLTVPDREITSVYSKIIQSDIQGKWLAHTSGAITSQVFFDIEAHGAKGASVHPICAVNQRFGGNLSLSKAYFTTEGTGAEYFANLLAKCHNPTEIISAEQKIKYHAAAVTASNLVCGLYDLAVAELHTCGLSPQFAEKALSSLFLENAKTLAAKGAQTALTGPVERGDDVTVRNHLNVLEADEKEIYTLLSRRLIAISEKKHTNRDYAKLYELLNGNKERGNAT